MKPAKHQYTILNQICQHIPAHLVGKLARSFGVDKKARSFSPWSHIVSMLHVQIAHSLSLNDVADTLRNHSGALSTIRGATPPSRNGLSHANRVRDPIWPKHSFGMCCPISKTNIPVSGLATSIPVCQGGLNGRSMR